MRLPEATRRARVVLEPRVCEPLTKPETAGQPRVTQPSLAGDCGESIPGLEPPSRVTVWRAVRVRLYRDARRNLVSRENLNP